MANLKLVLAALTLVVVVSSQESSADVMDICLRLEHMIIAKNLDGQKARDFTLDYLSRSILNIGGREKLKEALENIAKDGECSVSSLDYVATVARCTYAFEFGDITEAYAARCLTSEVLKKAVQIKIEAGGLFGRSAKTLRIDDVVDQQFVKDYLEAGVRERHPAWLGKNLYNPRVIAPIVKLLEGEAKKQDKGALEVYNSKDAIERYIKKEIVKPCKTYEPAALKLKDKLRLSGTFISGGLDALYKLLGQEGQMFIFRKDFCSDVRDNLRQVVSEVMFKLQSPSWGTEATS